MNTCIQCLVSIPELNHYFASNKFSVDKKSKKGTPNCSALREFIDSYEDSSSTLKAPASLYKSCHSFLEPNQQHDCQEFLRRFLTKIQEELNYNKKYTIPDKINFEKAWSIYRESNPSFIDSIFTGLMRSSVICNKCGNKSDTYDPFMDLSLPIKKKNVESLDNCLENYFSKEFIDCEYKCSSCKKKTSVKYIFTKF
jgi:ubiquitin C-terminal hydrolase